VSAASREWRVFPAAEWNDTPARCARRRGCVTLKSVPARRGAAPQEGDMPMIDVYAAAGTFADPKALARDLAAALMRVEQVPDIMLFRKNTAAFVHQMPVNALSNVAGDADGVRIQVLTNAAALDREKQLTAVVE